MYENNIFYEIRISFLFPMFDRTAIRAEKSSVDFVAMITTKCRVNCVKTVEDLPILVVI